MPRTIPEYSKSIIYKLCCKDPTVSEIYIGSTTNFRHRKTDHKKACMNTTSKKHNYPVYQFIRANGNWDNWDMIQIEQCNATDKRTLETRERYWIEHTQASLNRIIPTRTSAQYYEANKETIRAKAKQYREQNPEICKEQNNKHRQNNKESIQLRDKQYYERNQEKILIQAKQYYEKNKDAIQSKDRVRSRIYYTNNKEKLSIRDKPTMECECGSVVRYRDISKHKRSKEHQFWQTLHDFIIVL